MNIIYLINIHQVKYYFRSIFFNTITSYFIAIFSQNKKNFIIYIAILKILKFYLSIKFIFYLYTKYNKIKHIIKFY